MGRLLCYLEHRDLSPSQSGFRKIRTILHVLVTISTAVTKALAMKEVMSIVYFDIEKAFDTMWREGLLVKLNVCIGERMYNWIMDLLDRTFQVRLGSELSREYEVENGTPQGSTISPTLFTVIQGIGAALYADNGAIVIDKRQQAVLAVEE